MLSLLTKLLSKNGLIVAALIAALIGFGVAMVKNKQMKKAIEARESMRAEMLTKTGQIETYVNENGQLVTKLLQYEKHISDLANSNDSLEIEVYKAVKASSVKPKDVREAIVIYMQAENSGPVNIDTVFIDSLRVDTIYKTFNDGFLMASFNDDSLTYSYDEQLVLIKATRRVDRRFFLWRWVKWQKKINKDLVEITSNNPNSKLNGRVIKLE